MQASLARLGESPCAASIRIHAMPVSWASRFPAGFSPAPPFAALRRCGPRSVTAHFGPSPAGGL